MIKSVSCKDCGCLALRHSKTLELTGASEGYRQSGALPAENNRYLYDEIPVCVANAFNFAVMAPNKEASYSFVGGTQLCEQFIPWQPALSPKEHIEMRQLQEQREYNRQMLESDRLWRESQAKAEREWKEQERKHRADEAKEVEKRHVENWRSTERRFWIGLIAAVLFGLLGKWVEVTWINPPQATPVAPATLPPRP